MENEGNKKERGNCQDYWLTSTDNSKTLLLKIAVTKVIKQRNCDTAPLEASPLLTS